MKKPIYFITIILFFVAIAFAFYWYEWRPSKIRKNCEKSARVTESWGDISYETAYQGCLRYKGLEK